MTDPALEPIGGRLLLRVQGFLDRLRSERLRVGPGASVDLGHALDIVPVLDRRTVREACRVTLAKSPSDLATVDRVFDAYWDRGGSGPVPPASEEGKVPRPRSHREGTGRRPLGGDTSAPDSARPRLEGRYSAHAPDPGHRLVRVPSAELRRYRDGARRFRRRVASLPGRSWRRSPTGPIDLRRTAGRTPRTGGEWVELVHRDRALRRADLVVLWDVSGSMREHTGALLALVYSLHRGIRRTRVFAFGHDLEELTGVFQGRPYARLVPEVARQLAGAGGGTQIARCLGEFLRRDGSVLRPTTTVLIVSDGWDLGEAAPLAGVLEHLRSAVARIVWVNPYAAEVGFAPSTSALRTALPFVELLASPIDFPRPHGGSTGGRAARRLRLPSK